MLTYILLILVVISLLLNGLLIYCLRHNNKAIDDNFKSVRSDLKLKTEDLTEDLRELKSTWNVTKIYAELSEDHSKETKKKLEELDARIFGKIKLINNLFKDHLINYRSSMIKLDRNEQAISFINANAEKLEAGFDLIADTVGKDKVAQSVINGDFYVLLLNLKKSLGYQYNPRLEKILSEIEYQVNLNNEINDIEHGNLDEPGNGSSEGQTP